MTPSVIKLPGNLTETEEAILKFMYEHPNACGTADLVRQLRAELPGRSTQEQRLRDFYEVQYGVETLIASKLAKGRRLRDASGRVYFEKLQLTTSGEAEAIKQKRRLKTIVNHTARPKRQKS